MKTPIYSLSELENMKIPVGSANDLTGKVFGELKVLFRVSYKNDKKSYWACQCSCGVYVIKRGDRLENGHATYCRTIYHENIIGQQFGRLTVIRRTDTYTSAGWVYKCRCNCENLNTVYVSRNNLQTGNVKSCGCLKEEFLQGNHRQGIRSEIDIAGNVYGELTAIRGMGKDNTGHPIWEFKCSCGRYCVIRKSSVLSGNTSSCGHLNSIGENNIIRLLEENNIQFTYQKTFDDCRFKDTNALAKFDFYIQVDNPFILEFDSALHDGYTGNGWDTKERYEKTVNHDNFKNEYCFSHNIPIKRLPDCIKHTVTLDDILSDKYLLDKEQWWENSILNTELEYLDLYE